MTRKIGVILLAIIAVMCLSLAACQTGGVGMTKEEALQNYIFELDGQVVKEEFTLPRLIGDYRTTWTSDNELVVLEQRESDYLAKVTIPEEDVTVTLTADLRGATKDYTVRLQAITTQDIVDAYSFPQNRGTVYSDFALDETASYQGRVATIEWSVDDTSYIDVVDGYTCAVKPSSLNPEAKINATFTYKGVSVTTTYRFTVSEEMTHLQEINYWYNNTGVSVTMKGYVVEIATEWSSSYNNVSLYMVDEDLCCGYYLYRAGCDAANGAKLKPGVYVTCTGTTNQNYNGLIETNAGGTLTVDETKSIDLSETVYAVDNDVIAGAPAANYNQSRLVSLTNWKVKEAYKSEPVDGTTSTLFTLEKGGKTVSVAVSKYMEGAYLTKQTDQTWLAFVSKYNEIKDMLAAGEEVVVSVKGVMGYYNNPQILPRSADDIVIGGTVGKDDTVIGTAVKGAIASVDKVFNDIPKLIADTVSYALPATVDGVEVSYALLGQRTAFTYTEGKLIVTPGAAEVATMQVSFTYEGYTANKFYTMRSEALDDQGRADWEIKNFDVLTSITAVGTYTLPATSYFKNAKVTWTTEAQNVTVSGNTLTVNSLYFDSSKIAVTATVKVGEATSTREYYIFVSAYDVVRPVYAESAPENGTYAGLALYQPNLAKTLYATGEIANSYYLATSSERSEAAKLTVKKDETGAYTLQLGSKYLELKVADDKTSIVLNKEATAGFSWKWNSDYNTFSADLTGFTTESKNGEYYIGTYNTFNTFSCSAISYAKTSFPSGVVSEVYVQTAQDVLDEIIGSLEENVTSDFVLDCKATWELLEGSEGIELNGLTAVVTQTDKNQTATLRATLTYGTDEEGNPVTVTKDFVVTVPSLVYPKLSLAEFLALEDSTVDFYTIGGFVTKIVMDKNDATKPNAYGNIYIEDAAGTKVYVYGLNAEKMKYSGGWQNQKDFASLGIEVGMYVELVSAKGSYKGEAQAVGSGLVAKYEVKTIPEFLALEDSTETFYVVQGTVTKIGTNKDGSISPYGNVYIKDADDNELYIYGLNAEKMEYTGSWQNQKDFLSLGIEVGMDITVLSAKGSYKGAGQAVGSGLLYKVAAEQGGEEEKPVTPVDPTPVEGTTAKVTIADYADANGWENAKVAETCKIDDVVTVSVSVETYKEEYGQNTGKYYENGENWRIYQNETPSIVIAAKDGYKLLTVKITYVSDKTGVITNGTAQVESDAVITVNAQSITLSVGNTGTATNGQARITAIEVVYTTSEGGDTPVDPTPGEGEEEKPADFEEAQQKAYEEAEAKLEELVKAADNAELSDFEVLYIDVYVYTKVLKPILLDATTVEDLEKIQKDAEAIYQDVKDIIEGKKKVELDAVRTATAEAFQAAWGVIEAYYPQYIINAYKDDFTQLINKVKAAETEDDVFAVVEEYDNILKEIENKLLGIPEEGEYHYGLVQKGLDETPFVYALGQLTSNGYYLDTTTDATKAATYTLTKVDGGYTITTVNADGKVLYLEIVYVLGTDGKYHANVTLSETKTVVWAWNSTYGVMTITLNETEYYLGTYGENSTFRPSAISYITDSTSYYCIFVPDQIVFTLEEEKALALDAVSDDWAQWAKQFGEDNLAKYQKYYDDYCKKIEAAKDEKEFDFIIDVYTDLLDNVFAALNGSITTVAAPQEGEYFYVVEQLEINKTLYVIDKIKDDCFMTTTDKSKAAKVVLAKSGDGYVITIGGKYLEVVDKIEYAAVALLDEPTGAVWTWNEFYGVMTYSLSDGPYFLESYEEYDDVTAAHLSYVYNGELGDTDFACQFVAYEASEGGEQGGEEKPVDPVDPVETVATLDFTNENNRESHADDKQVWKQNGITLVHEKGGNNNNVSDAVPIRLYQNSKVTISYKGMTKIVFNCNSYRNNDYANVLKNSITIGTVTVDGLVATVVFAAPVDELVIEALTAQVRLDSLTVYAGTTEGGEQGGTEGGEQGGEAAEELAQAKEQAKKSVEELYNGLAAQYGETAVKAYQDQFDACQKEIAEAQTSEALEAVGTKYQTVFEAIAKELAEAAQGGEQGGTEGGETGTTETTKTLTVSIADYASKNNWTNESDQLTIKLDEYITVTGVGSKYYTSGTEWRLYQSSNSTVTVTAAEGYTIVSVKFTYNSNKNGVLLNGENQVKSDETVDVNAQNITFSVGNTGTKTNGQARVTAIEVVYVKNA